MYCSNCGTQLPENSKFCTNCGASAMAAPSAHAAAQVKPKKSKKRAPVWLSVVVIVAAFLLGKFVLAPSFLSEPEKDQDSYQQEQMQEDVQQPVADITPSNSKYDEIFLSRNIVEMPAFFMMLDSAAFAAVDTDGIIEKLEFGYDGDTIKEMVNTLYYPISDMNDDQRNELDAVVKQNLEAYTSVDFCTATYNMGNLYYTVTLHFVDLDAAENIQKMSELGLVSVNAVDYLSMAQTESDLIAGGYVKK